MQLTTFGGNVNRSDFTTTKKYLFANLLLFESAEGDETTYLSFLVANARIDASSALLEALIAT